MRHARMDYQRIQDLAAIVPIMVDVLLDNADEERLLPGATV